ncbi:PepSY domain-containing protein [Corynebacterium xerosis]|uniref:PepSY domain-containing protein n=1 Tax=Corynebacterium xerosis TaxID=1725 RepID=UPI0039C1150F
MNPASSTPSWRRRGCGSWRWAACTCGGAACRPPAAAIPAPETACGAPPPLRGETRAAARAEGLTGPLVLRPPAEAGEGWRVSERWVAWRTASDSIVVDGADGRVASRQPFAELPFFSKLSSWGIYLHMGIMFGLPLQLALFAAGAGIAVIIVLGYRMWWLRRPTVRGTSVPGLPDSPSWRIVAGVVVFAATVGAFLPLLGISLIGFLLLDLVLIGRSRARRRTVEKQLEAAVLPGGTP